MSRRDDPIGPLEERERELRMLLSAAKMAYDQICAPLLKELVRLESLKPTNPFAFINEMQQELLKVSGIDQIAWSRDPLVTIRPPIDDWSPPCPKPSPSASKP